MNEIEYLRLSQLPCEECKTLREQLLAQQTRIASLTCERDELRQFHDASMVELAKLVGADVIDEPRFKWVHLEISNRLMAQQARIAELEEQIDLQVPKGVMLAQMARIAELRELVKRLVDVSPGHAGQCSGLKCREPYCYSCNEEDDANEYLQGVWNLCGEANEALSRTDDLSTLAAHDAEVRKAALLEAAEWFKPKHTYEEMNVGLVQEKLRRMAEKEK